MESAYGWKILVPGVWWLSMACRLSHACMHTHVRKYEHMHLHNYMHRLSRHISSNTRRKQDILESDWLPLKPLTALVYHAYCTNILRSVTNPDTLRRVLYKSILHDSKTPAAVWQEMGWHSCWSSKRCFKQTFKPQLPHWQEFLGR